MVYQKKIEIMKAAVRAEIGNEVPEELLEKGIIDGFLRIEQLDSMERRAAAPYFYFPVERVQEGFAFWNSGGFDRFSGKSAVAAGADGEKLRLVRYKNEKNGNHSLSIIYPGCFLAMSSARDVMESYNTIVYRVISFEIAAQGYVAKCQKVLQIDPYYSALDREQENRLQRLIKVSNRIATTPDLYKLRNWV